MAKKTPLQELQDHTIRCSACQFIPAKGAVSGTNGFGQDMWKLCGIGKKLAAAWRRAE